MIKYFIELFTKPNYQWTFLDSLAFSGLIISVFFIIGIIWFIIWFILESIKEHKYHTCEKSFKGQPCWHHQDCLRCSEYKKESKKEGKSNE